MSTKAFDPNAHLMQLKDKDYLQVMWRLVWLRDRHPEWGIDTQALEITEDHAVFRAVITDDFGRQVSCGHGSESKRDFGDFIEKAETKAVGRALAMAGFGTQFTADELDEGERIVDSPVPVQISLDIPPEGCPLEMQPAYVRLLAQKLGITTQAFGADRNAAVAAGIVPDKRLKDFTPAEFAELCSFVKGRH